MDQVIRETPGDSRLEMCIQCGTCGGSCPSGPDMDHTPRQIFAMIRADMCEEVLRSNTPWYCVSCYYCMVRCPQEVHITDLMYTLKSMSLRSKLYKDKAAPDLARTFSRYVVEYGRAFEFGLATIQSLSHRTTSVQGLAQLGLGMLGKRRMDLTPHRIKGLDQLKAILQKADAMEEEARR